MTRWLLVTLWLILGIAANQNALAQSNSAVAPDGRTLAIGTANNDIALWETKTGTLKARMKGHCWPLFDLTFAPDGATLASWNQAGEAILWDARTGTLKQWLRREHTPSGEWTPVAFSTDGREVAVGERQAGPGPPGQKLWTPFLRMWDAHTGVPIRTIPLGPFSNVESIRFWPDGNHVTLGLFGQVQVWDWREGKLDWSGPPDGSLVSASRDGKLAVTSGPVSLSSVPSGPRSGGFGGDQFGSLGGKSVSNPTFPTPDIWDMAARRRVSRLVSTAYDTDSAFFSPDRRTVVTRGHQQRTSGDTGYTAYEWKVWDVQTGRLLWSFGKDEYVGSVCFSPDSKLLLSRGRILDVRTGRLVRTLETPSADASVLFSLDGKIVAASSADPPVFWDAKTGKRRVSPLGNP